MKALESKWKLLGLCLMLGAAVVVLYLTEPKEFKNERFYE